MLFQVGFAVVGLLVISLALSFGRRLGPAPIDIELNKLGISFKSEIVSLMTLGGLLLIFSSGYFYYSDFQRQLDDLKQKVDASDRKTVEAEEKVLSEEQRKQAINDTAQEFKAHWDEVLKKSHYLDVGVQMIFPSDATSTSKLKSIKEVQVTIQRPSEPTPVKPKLPVSEGASDNELSLVIPNLALGDTFQIFMQVENETWKSDRVVLPRMPVLMTKVPKTLISTAAETQPPL